VGLVEARAGPNLTNDLAPTPNPRSYALSPSSLKLLRLGQNPEESTRLGYYNSMQVWEAGHPASLLFNDKDIQEGDTLGAVVEDEVIVRTLWARVQGNCKLFTDSSVSNVTLPRDVSSGLARVQLESSGKDASPKEIETKLLIGADGSNSIVRRLVGIPKTTLEYDQHALTFTVKLKGTHHKRAYQRFLSTGPIALLPTFLPDHSIVVWSTTPAMVQEWKKNPNLIESHQLFVTRWTREGGILDEHIVVLVVMGGASRSLARLSLRC